MYSRDIKGTNFSQKRPILFFPPITTKAAIIAMEAVTIVRDIMSARQAK